MQFGNWDIIVVWSGHSEGPAGSLKYYGRSLLNFSRGSYICILYKRAEWIMAPCDDDKYEIYDDILARKHF